jgi:hypothetical protein
MKKPLLIEFDRMSVASSKGTGEKIEFDVEEFTDCVKAFAESEKCFAESKGAFFGTAKCAWNSRKTPSQCKGVMDKFNRLAGIAVKTRDEVNKDK